MALSEFEERRIHKVVGSYLQTHRPPPHLRDELDIWVGVQDQSAVIHLRRRLADGGHLDSFLAKATWVKSRQLWKIYWLRASGRWQSYEPRPEVTSLEDFCRVIDDDEYGCFWG